MEMGELRRIENQLCEVFEAHGYGQVATPTIEHHSVLERGDEVGAPEAFRLFDESGNLLVLRTDMTVPIARLVATRFGSVEPPYRFFYFGSCFRAIRPQRGQMREFRQAGIELIGADAPDGTAELIRILAEALDKVGLNRAVIGLGDADLFRQVLDGLGVEGTARDSLLDHLAAHDLVALERDLAAIPELASDRAAGLLKLANLRGGVEVIAKAREISGVPVAALDRIQATVSALEDSGILNRVQIDFGLLRDLGYYTGAIIEVYDPAVGHVIGGGGRYDRLIGRFGRDLPAAGFALYTERLHIAQAEEERFTAESGTGEGS